MTKHSENATESATSPLEYAGGTAKGTTAKDSYSTKEYEAVENQASSETYDECDTPEDAFGASLAANDSLNDYGADESERPTLEASTEATEDIFVSGMLKSESGEDSVDSISDRSEAGQMSFKIPKDLAETVGETVAKYTTDGMSADELMKEYLVIGNGVFFYTDNEDIIPGDEDTIHMLADPGSDIGSLVAEIEDILK